MILVILTFLNEIHVYNNYVISMCIVYMYIHVHCTFIASKKNRLCNDTRFVNDVITFASHAQTLSNERVGTRCSELADNRV